MLRDHDCVIIPEFGGLVAEVSSARAQPGRQSLSPPTKLVAFNQALTRNDGLLVDALSQHLHLPIAQAREVVRQAVAGLQQELDETNRTELPGIGIFRRSVGRGLAFEYTGTDNLLASSFGLPDLAARPVRATDARVKRPQPALRGATTRRTRWTRLLPGGAIAMAMGLLLLANYQWAINAGFAPTGWQAQLPNLEWSRPQVAATVLTTIEPQQANLGQHNFTPPQPAAPEGMTPLEASPAASVTVPEVKPAPVAGAPAPVVAAPAVATATPAASVAAVETAAPVIAAVAPVKPANTAAAVTIKNRTGRYYVIAGAYRSLAGAERGRKVLARTGHASHIILPPFGSRLFRLTAADYPDLASAQREAQRLRVTTRSDYNTLKF
ncbi:hypothetical protein BEN48_01135 [Hymenobacter glacialis]|uniref:SPOR domain-containing protein n=1 Tax=Hymenobacter glacialis TaxID=1908236 RepID=A0A1G1T7Y7_9BACT|nr:hypothetical protein BEN48_01135 [Hymenobacter glacialis]